MMREIIFYELWCGDIRRVSISPRKVYLNDVIYDDGDDVGVTWSNVENTW